MIFPAVLSTRESQIYLYLANGYQRIDIGARLKLSYNDVYGYTTLIQKKLKLKTFTELREYIRKNK